jgi:colicin import membrane protein
LKISEKDKTFMFQDRSYKKAVIFAVILHVIVLVFLFVKFVTPSRFTSSITAGNVVQAVAVSQKDIKVAATPIVKETPPAPVQPIVTPKPVVLPVAVKTPVDVIIKQKQKEKKLKAKEMQMMQQELARETKALADQKKQALMEQDLAKELSLEKKQAAAVPATSQSSQNLPGAAASSGELDKYKAALLQAIAANWIVPDGVDKNATCLLLVKVAPGGVVLDAKITQGSGNDALDRSAQTAVLKTSPLPVPTDPVLFDAFRSIKLIVRPSGIGAG